MHTGDTYHKPNQTKPNQTKAGEVAQQLEHLFLLPRTWVWLPEPRWWLVISLTTILGHLTPSSNLWWHTSKIHTWNKSKKKKKLKKKCSQLIWLWKCLAHIDVKDNWMPVSGKPLTTTLTGFWMSLSDLEARHLKVLNPYLYWLSSVT